MNTNDFNCESKMNRIRCNQFLNCEYDGSISIMLALILVTLLAFLMTIYDHTRLRMIQVQSMSSYGLAADYMLSQYDPVLFQEYGLLAGKSGPETELFFADHLEKNLFPSTAKEHEYYMDYILEPDATSVFNGMMEPEKYEFNIDYEPFLQEGLSYPKSQIIEYMDSRLSLMLAKDWGHIMDYFTKTSKTSSVIQEKNDLVKSMGDLEFFKKQLYQLIDGITLYENGDWTFNRESGYIRCFSPNSDLNYDYFPKTLVPEISKDVIILDEVFSHFETEIEEVDKLMSILFSNEAFGRVEFENREGEIDVLYVPQPIVEESIERLKALDQSFGEYEMILGELMGLKEIHIEALDLIEDYYKTSKEHTDEIHAFLETTQEDDALLESVVTSIDTELKDLEAEISSEIKSLKETDNLNVIKIQLEKNLQALSGAEPYLNVLNENLHSLIYGIFLEKYNQSSRLTSTEKNILEDLISSDFEKTDEEMEYTTMKNLYGFAEAFLSSYDSNILMDYSSLTSDDKMANTYEDREEEAKNYDISQIIWSKFSELMGEEEIDSSLLPSAFFEDVNKNNSDGLGNKGSLTDKQTYTTDSQEQKSGGIGGFLSGGFDKVSDNLSINTYAIEMFTNFNRRNDINAKALNGYKVNDHRMKYETEYIIGGSLNERQNVDIVLSYIYAFRTSLNLIHLATDSDKRATIMHLASMVAGWWTGGVGAVIFAVIIAGLWAILESVADVFLLTSGEKVPIIKTSATWYTFLDGNIEELFNAAVRRLEDETMVIIEKGKDLVEEKMSDLDIEITDPVKEFISILGNEKYEMDEQKKAELENERIYIEAYLEKWIFYLMDFIDEGKSLEGLEGQCLELLTYQGKQTFEDLVSDMADSILEKIMENEDESDLAELARIKKAVLEEYQTQENNVINDLMEDYEIEFNKILDIQLEGLKLVTEKALEEKIKLGKKVYYDYADDIKEEYLGVGKTDSIDMDFLLPSMSYEDYLLLILSLPQYSQETKVARILDLIQLNLQKKYNDENISLLNYYVGVDVSGKVYAYSMFIPSQLTNHSKFWEIDIESIQKDFR